MTDKCQCKLATRLVGDGCQYCNPQLAIDILEEKLEELRLTDEERWFIERHIEYLIQWTRENGESSSVNQELQAYRGLLERQP